MALQDILERKEILLKLNDMSNKKAAKIICSRNCTYNSKDCKKGCETFKDVLQMAKWKDEQLANCIECLEKEYIKNSGKGLLSNEEIAARLATLRRIKEEMK